MPRKRVKDRSVRPPDLPRAERAVRELLDALGLDPDDPALSTTPRTVARAYAEQLLDGYRTSPDEAIGRGFPITNSGPVVAARIPLFFVCPHHLLPAFGEAHVAFRPQGHAPGLGRIARLVDALSHRLILQEDLTRAIATALEAHAGAAAAAVIIEARHLCVAVDDFARRETTFRTSAGVGPEAEISSLVSEIDAILGSAWPTSMFQPQSEPPGSRSPSGSRPRSAATPKGRTKPPPRRPSPSGASSPRRRSSE